MTTAAPARKSRRLDLHRLGGELDALAGRRLDTHAFQHEAMARLRHVVPADAFCFSAADPDTLITTAHACGGTDLALARVVYDNEFGAIDVAKHADLARGRRPVRVLALETRGERDRSARYRDLLCPMGMEHELRAATIERGTTWGFVHLFRGAHRAPFDRDEVEAVSRVGRHLAAGIRAAALQPSSPSADEPAAPGVLLLDADDRIALRAGAADAWLAAAHDPDFAGDVLPVLTALAAAARHGGTQIPRARVRDRDGAWWLLHATGTDGGRPDQVAITVQHAAGPQMTTLVMHAFGLSSAEQEVCELVLAGRSTKEIAAGLRISPWTVQDRLKSVFAKTDVRSRRELVATLNPPDPTDG